jgi:methyl-accepting chemotaxis protein
MENNFVTKVHVDEAEVALNLRTVRIVMGVYVFLMAFGIYLVIESRDLRTITITVMSAIVLPVLFFVRSIIKQGHLARAGWVIVASVILSVLVTVMLDPGNTWIMGPVVAMACALIASQMMDIRRAGWGVLASIVGGALIVISDVFLREHYDFSVNEVVTVALAVAILFAWLLVRRFSTFAVGVKMLLVTSGLALLTAGTLTYSAYWIVTRQITDGALQAGGLEIAEYLARAMAFISAVVTVVAGGVALLMSRLITRPLSRLVRIADAIAQRGDLSQTTALGVKDEIGQLGISFNRVVEHFRELAQAAGRIADNDLTGGFEPKSEVDAVGQAFEQMNHNLRRLIAQVSSGASVVNAASGQLSAAADQSARATSQVAATIQQVAAGTARQAENVTQATAAVDLVSRVIDGVAQGAQEQAAAIGESAESTASISVAIQQVVASAQAGSESAAQATQTARDGAETIARTIAGMDNIRDKVALSAHKVQEMGRHSVQIGTIVEMIDNIASQTNLLALNAAIEAARAGEHGKGFAVVADEVRKLAENAAAATKEITGLIGKIQRVVGEAVQAMEEGSMEVEAGAAQADEAGRALDGILTAAEAVNRQVEDIATAAVQMDASANELVGAMDAVSAVTEENTAATAEMGTWAGEVLQAIEHVSAIAGENSAASEGVSAAAEEMTAQVEEVTASAQSLSGMAQELQALVAQFKLPGDGDAGTQEPGGETNRWSAAFASVTPEGGNGRGYEKPRVVRDW